MKVYPLGRRPREVRGAGRPGGSPSAARYASQAPELAQLRRDMPQIGFLFDGRHWWGVYGQLVIMYASDLDLLLEQMPEAIRRAHEAASD
jgi:hypothetical protein